MVLDIMDKNSIIEQKKGIDLKKDTKQNKEKNKEQCC